MLKTSLATPDCGHGLRLPGIERQVSQRFDQFGLGDAVLSGEIQMEPQLICVSHARSVRLPSPDFDPAWRVPAAPTHRRTAPCRCSERAPVRFADSLLSARPARSCGVGHDDPSVTPMQHRSHRAREVLLEGVLAEHSSSRPGVVSVVGREGGGGGEEERRGGGGRGPRDVARARRAPGLPPRTHEDDGGRT